MSKRKLVVFLTVVLAWTIAVAVFGAVNMPNTVLPYARAHAPAFIYQIIDIWGVVPAIILLLLVGQSPAGAVFRRLINRGRDVPHDREKWGRRTMVVLALFMVLGQAWQTLALVLLWHKRQLPWVAQAMQGPHWAGLPDPHHLIARLWPAAAGLLFAWVGNGLPKLLSPFRGGPEPYDWAKMMRTNGWVMTLCGLAGAACSLFVADLRTAVLAGAAILVAPFVAFFPIWAIYRLSGGRDGVAPPESP